MKPDRELESLRTQNRKLRSELQKLNLKNGELTKGYITIRDQYLKLQEAAKAVIAENEKLKGESK